MKRDGRRRRAFLKNALIAAPAAACVVRPVDVVAGPATPSSVGLKLSCNLYSFNGPLTKREMTLEEVIDFCAAAGFAAVDPTAYYFPNYPSLPPDDYVYEVKRKAFRAGLDISGTGVRNDFTLADRAGRAAQVESVKKWVEFAAKLGAPVLRVFSGKEVPAGHSEKEATEWLIESLRTCADYGAKFGVMIVLQNHNDFIRDAEQVPPILRAVNSEWLALNLDIGSFHRGDPYQAIALLAPHAATWQIKENLFVNGREEKTNLNKIAQIVKQSGYRGYLPIETLGAGDPRRKVPRFLSEVRAALDAIG